MFTSAKYGSVLKRKHILKGTKDPALGGSLFWVRCVSLAKEGLEGMARRESSGTHLFQLSYKDKVSALQIKAALFKIQIHNSGSQSNSSLFYAVFDVSTSSPRPHSTQLKILQLFWSERCWLCFIFNIPRSASSAPVSPYQQFLCWAFLKSLHWKWNHKIEQDFECPGWKTKHIKRVAGRYSQSWNWKALGGEKRLCSFSVPSHLWLAPDSAAG